MEEENNTPSLHDRLQAATTMANPQSADQKKASDFWSEEDSFDPAEIEEEPAPSQVEKQREDLELEEDPKKPLIKITDKAKRASAATAAGMQDMLQTAIFTPIINWKYGKKFNEKELEKLDEGGLMDADIEKIQDEADKKLRNKWDRLMKRRDKKVNAVMMTDKEKKDLEDAWLNYFEYTEKTLPPIYLVIMQSLNSFGARVVDIVTE